MANYFNKMAVKKAFTGRRMLLLIVFLAAAGGLGTWYFQKDRVVEEEEAEKLPKVVVMSLAEMRKEAKIFKVAPVEPAVSAPLVARMGGRVTALEAQLGDMVEAGEIVVEVDGAGVASPALAQLNSAAAALAVFDEINEQARRSADLTVQLAEMSLNAAKTGQTITLDQLNKSRTQADLSVRQAELAFKDAVDSENRLDAQVRAADIALKAAGLARDQATIARNAGTTQTKQAIEQAQKNLEAARAGRESTIADLANQRVQISGQLAAARAQFALTQISSPVTGEVTRLMVKTGDILQPGQVVGEVLAEAGARVRLDVSTGIRRVLTAGQTVELKAGSQEFTGQIAALAEAPNSESALWQVDIFIAATPEVIHPGDLVTVALAAAPDDKAIFMPLDAVVLRQDVSVLMTVNGAGLVEERGIKVISYIGELVEIELEADPETRIIVSGNRTIRAGEMVEVNI